MIHYRINGIGVKLIRKKSPKMILQKDPFTGKSLLNVNLFFILPDIP